MSTIRPPLTTSMTGPVTTSSASFSFSMVAPGPFRTGPASSRDEAPLLVLLLEDQRLDGLAQRDDLRGVDVVADGKLAYRDHALGLETDVEEDLVAIDLDDRSLDEVTVLELDDRAGHGVLEGRPLEVVLGDRPGM